MLIFCFQKKGGNTTRSLLIQRLRHNQTKKAWDDLHVGVFLKHLDPIPATGFKRLKSKFSPFGLYVQIREHCSKDLSGGMTGEMSV